MAGNFIKTLYAADYSPTVLQTHPIRVQPESVTLTVGGVANAAPTSAQTNPISAIVSRNKRQKGLHPRKVVLKAPATGQPAGYAANGLTTVPCLTPAFYAACVAATSATVVSYLGASGYTVSYTESEVAK